MWEQCYESQAPELKNGLTIIDAGANVGMSALYFLNRYQVEKIFCIEPDLQNLKILKKNISNEIANERAIIIEAALSDISGRASWDSEGLAYNSKLALSPGDVIVQTITINDVIEKYNIQKIDLIKFDIEGAESLVFSSDSSWLKKVDSLIIEIHSDAGLKLFEERISEYNFKWRAVNRNKYSSIYYAFRDEIT
jgi:FkbM family methyltransferase